MNNQFRDNGGKLPAGLGIIRNTSGHSIFVSPYPRKRKREPIVKVRKSKNLFNLLFGWLWEWQCSICYQNRLASTWEKALHQATHHAHNHH